MASVFPLAISSRSAFLWSTDGVACSPFLFANFSTTERSICRWASTSWIFLLASSAFLPEMERNGASILLLMSSGAFEKSTSLTFSHKSALGSGCPLPASRDEVVP